jgi:beta-aspartyl-peptidase (threonine type)
VRVLVVHGGAGGAPRPGSRAQSACEAALARGWEILAAGGSALDAVTGAVVALEDDPALNAGYGACLTAAGTVELDAAVIEGAARRAGAVAMIRRLRHPVLLARALLEEGRHVLMVGAAAEELAAARGMPLVEPETLITPERRRAWEERVAAGAGDDGAGTVGAVALDGQGRLAAATSTGGMAMKRPGRVGDSAVVGAGTWADDRAGAAAATGDGEAIMRAGLARAAVDLLRHGLAPERAAARALAEVTGVGGTAGIVLVDRFGRLAGAHTAPHMTWCARRG